MSKNFFDRINLTVKPNRTVDDEIANLTPEASPKKVRTVFPSPLFVEDNGFEPLTLCVQGRCSSQLS